MFKENDKVYCPIIGSDIYTLGSADLLTHPVTIVNSAGIPLCFTEEGKLDHGEFVPSLFRVNEANRVKLESLYGISFTNLSKDIVKCLLEKQPYVVCWVSQTNKQPDSSCHKDVIYRVDDYYFDGYDTQWTYATPFDPITNEAITGV